MLNPFDRRAKTAPSHYPRVAFHGIRLFQLISSLIVAGIMSFFIYHLTHDHWWTPWTFIWLTTASLASIAVLAFTICLHCFTGLNPRLNLVMNCGLAVLWALSWSLLTWSMSGTLKNKCDIEHWNEDSGIMVCRIYKALFSFTLLGFLSTVAALCLDVYVRRQQASRGMYRLQDLDTKPLSKAVGGAFTDDEGTHNYSESGLAAEPRESEAWDEPRPSIGPYNEQSEMMIQKKGYEVPDAQFDYDTGYRGGHPEGA